MTRVSDRRAPILFALAAACALAGATPGRGQVTIYNSGGFESTPLGAIGPYGTTAGPGQWTTTDLNQLLGGTPAGTVQTGTVQSGARAFRINGPGMIDDTAFSDQTFWFRGNPNAGQAFNPVANGTPL